MAEEVHLLLGRLEGKLDSLLARIDSIEDAHKERSQSLEKQHEKLEERLAKVESLVWKLSGAAMVLGGSGAAAIMKLFGGGA